MGILLLPDKPLTASSPIWFFFFLFLLVCGIPSNPIRETGKIFGGTRAEKGNFPWQVYFEHPRGAGVLISERWVMTAAHVLDGYDMPSMFAGTINIGGRALYEEGKRLVPEASFIHPGWKRLPTGSLPTGLILIMILHY